jgi:hypothetical protein
VNLKPGEHVIYLEKVDDDEGVIEGGYLIPYIGINRPIYARGAAMSDALVMSADEAIETILDFRDSGWACRAVPPIVATF